MRSIALNTQYIVLFRNSRDNNQIKLLARQTSIDHLFKAYQRVTSEPFQPLLIDLHPLTDDKIRLRSHLFGDYQFVYLE
jgi:hypothetical protein